MFRMFPRKKVTRISHRSRLRGIESCESRNMFSIGPPTVVAVEVSGSAWTSSFVDYLESNSLGTNGFTIPTGSNAQTTAVPWSNVNQLRIRFNEDVQVDAADLTLSGVNVTGYQFSGFSYDVDSFEAVWTLNTSLDQDVLLIDLDTNGLDPVTDLSGAILDGEWTDNVTSGPSGNGTAGGDFQFKIKANPGDYNQSGLVNSTDYYGVYAKRFTNTSSPSYSAFADINGSGEIDVSDLNLAYANYTSSVPSGNPAGDTNDGPTAGTIASLEIFDDTATTSVSLHAAFADVETSDSNLVYTVSSNSNSTLFDLVSINTSTGMLNLSTAPNKIGRSLLTLKATDAGGLSTFATFTVDVDQSNSVPTIDLVYEEQAPGVYLFEGIVADTDDNLTGRLITLSGLIQGRVKVLEDGSFSILVSDLYESGLITAEVDDLQGASDSDTEDTSAN